MSGSEKNIMPNSSVYYNCHRSGYFKSKGKGIRHLNIQGSKKLMNSVYPRLKKPFNAIIEEVRDSLSTSEELQRLHLVTRKDLHNIESSFQLSSNSVKHMIQ
ncbi:uncharacterized protein [Centruroides vittatus]|uniref:uncharacterized protein n=1 Tax=Centruroides vittatus TaxID=120091 RepID=UPI00350E9C46